jgi:hypothetical protein
MLALVAAVLIGIVVYGVKKWIDSLLQSRVNRMSEVLRADLDASLARQAEDLRMYAEMEIAKAARAGGATLAVVTGTMERMKKAQRALAQLTMPLQEYRGAEVVRKPEDFERVMRDQAVEDLVAAAKAFNEFSEWFEAHRVFLPRTTCEKFDNAARKFRDAHLDMRFALQWESRPFQGSGESVMNLRRAASEIGTSEFPQLVAAIEDDLRALVGTDQVNGARRAVLPVRSSPSMNSSRPS